MSKRKFYPFIIVLLVAAVIIFIWWKDSVRLDDYINNPEVGDIYILQEDNVYAPMKIDKIDSQSIWMLNYLYFFADAVPDRELILDNEWDLSNHLIYEPNELKRLFDQGRIIEIYRD